MAGWTSVALCTDELTGNPESLFTLDYTTDLTLAEAGATI